MNQHGSLCSPIVDSSACDIIEQLAEVRCGNNCSLVRFVLLRTNNESSTRYQYSLIYSVTFYYQGDKDKTLSGSQFVYLDSFVNRGDLSFQ